MLLRPRRRLVGEMESFCNAPTRPGEVAGLCARVKRRINKRQQRLVTFKAGQDFLSTISRIIRHGWPNFRKSHNKAQMAVQTGRGGEKSNILLGWWIRSGYSNKINGDLELLIHENSRETID